MRVDPRQLDLFAPPPAAPVEPDEFAQKLQAAGLAPNDYLLNITGNLGHSCEAIPSRLFRWPVEFVDRGRRDDGKRVLLNHPLIGDHPAVSPFVKAIEEATGERVTWEEFDEYGRFRDRAWYFHAIDLMTPTLLPILRETRDFCDLDGVTAAVGYAVRYSTFPPQLAREVLVEFGDVEPKDRSAKTIKRWIKPDPFWYPEGKLRLVYGMNEGWSNAIDGGRRLTVWAMIHGLELGWFGYTRGSGKHLTMTDTGNKALGVAIPPKPGGPQQDAPARKKAKA